MAVHPGSGNIARWPMGPAADRTFPVYAGHKDDHRHAELRRFDRPDVAAPGRPALTTVIGELAEHFVRAEANGFEDAVVGGLGSLARALDMDWGVLWRGGSSTAEPTVSIWIREAAAFDDAALRSLCGPLVAATIEAGSSTSWGPDAGELGAGLASSGTGFAFVHPLPRDAASGHDALAFGAATTAHDWTGAIASQLRIAAAIFSQAVAAQNRRSAAPPTSTPAADADAAPLTRRSGRIAGESRREDVAAQLGDAAIVGTSPAIRAVLEQVQQVARTDSTVLLLGETGTGKELIATQIHELSARRGRGMVKVNCAAIPNTLIESELFGREKGAFTGALTRQMGRFEAADRSTIFLDEIGDLPSDVQVKLLRVLEERQIERLGSPRSIPVDVRIVAATHRDLEKRIAAEAFREDLFYRLNVFPIRVPALRERVDDIPLLVWHFVIEFSRTFGKRIDAISHESMAAMQRYLWPGNIRELRNVVERAMIVSSGSRLTVNIPETSAAPVTPVRTRLEDVEREHIRSILERSRWRIRGTGGAAEQLGLRPTTLETRMAKLGLFRPKIA